MKHFVCTLLMIAGFMAISSAQEFKPWSAKDRAYLLEHLTATRDAVINETKNLSPAQWSFKESVNRWSINQVLEHLVIWEIIFQREINQAIVAGPRPELTKDARTDSAVLAFLDEDKPHISTEYTKPFTFTVPMGLNDGKNNLTWFLKMWNEGIGFVDSTKADLRVYFMRAGKGSVHQVFLSTFGHADRHLKQIRRVKADPNYPKK
ncbi:MAG: DinB family protein [Bacteroidota bacterium]